MMTMVMMNVCRSFPDENLPGVLRSDGISTTTWGALSVLFRLVCECTYMYMYMHICMLIYHFTRLKVTLEHTLTHSCRHLHSDTHHPSSPSSSLRLSNTQNFCNISVCECMFVYFLLFVLFLLFLIRKKKLLANLPAILTCRRNSPAPNFCPHSDRRRRQSAANQTAYAHRSV